MRGLSNWVVCLSLAVGSGCANEDDAGSAGDEGSSSSEASSSTTTTTTTTSTTTSGTTTTTTSTTGDPETTEGSSSGTTGDEGGIGQCFVDDFVGPAPLPNYDQFGVVYGEHCLGSNHQDIMQVDRVVFLGDSVTVGTPPSPVGDYYRSRLADALADRFALDTGASYGLWKTPNAIEGTSLVRNSGDFWSCSKWGARNDDLMSPQIEDCFPAEFDDSRTLVIMTMGGNDLAAWARDFADGTPVAEVWMEAEEMVAYKREAIEFLTDTERFPNGNMVVFANVYEFTDATGNLMSCDLSGLAGFDQPVPTPTDLLIVVGWIQEQYAKIAAETQTDFVFMFESFCGHGFAADDPRSPCYRGPGSENWFDLTCIHPTPTGHGAIADMFLAVIDE